MSTPARCDNPAPALPGLHALQAERDAAVAQQAAAQARCDAAITERDAVLAERDAVVAERDAALAQRDAATAERDAAVAERDAALAQRDAAWATGAARLRFLAAAGHDLRQPLHALGLSSAAVAHLARQGAHAPLARLADDMAHALRHIGDLVDNLSDLAQLDAGRLAARPQDGPLLPVVQDALRLFSPLAQARGLQLQLDLPKPPGPSQPPAAPAPADDGQALQVRTDPLLLQRVLSNLLANSLKYTPSGGTVAVQLQALADGRVQLVVQDSGVGIAEHEQAQVFDEFFRGQTDPHPPAHAPGLGLGLAIVRRITTLLDIGLSLHSQPGTGTRVTLLLPAAQGVFSRADRRSGAGPTSAAAAA